MKKGLIIIAILLVIAGTCFGIYYEVKTFGNASNTNSIKKDSTTSEEVKSDNETVETDITDGTTILTLTNKINKIMGEYDSDTNSYPWMMFSFGVLKNGLKDEYIQQIVLKNVEWEAASTQSSLLEDLKSMNCYCYKCTTCGCDEECNGLLYQASGDKVDKSSINLFGKKIESPIQKIEGCPEYRYDSETKTYYKILGCGGTGPATILDYKYSFKQKGDETYVYVAYAYQTLGDNENTIIYKDFSNNGKLYSFDFTDKYKEDSSFKLDSTNYKDFTSYKYTFKKDDNNYYLSSVEKVN